MILEIDDWKFEVDLEATMEYSAKEAAEHCDCGYCRNFYAAIDGKYPDLRPFLAQFGIDVEVPAELFPYEPTCYSVSYAVYGRILTSGMQPIVVDGVPFTAEAGDKSIGPWTNRLRGDYFILDSDMFTLPWVLDEPMEDVISTANEPSFIQKMINRLLGKQDKNAITS